jgi:hypothetical protein
MINLEVNQILPVIQTNFDMVKASLIEEIAKYKGLVVMEEDLKGCKADQKELASMRTQIDNYRKDIKREAEKPIKAFEEQCKELIGLIVEAETPLKEGIAVFDQKKRDANKKIAEDIILEAIAEHGLNEKYSCQLTVLDKYMNLTAKPSEVKNDVEQRLFLLLQEQEQEAEVLQIMTDTIENCNKNIDAKMSMEDFQSLIDAKASPVKVMQEIQARAERIKIAEEKAVAEKAARAEKEVQERIAKAEREAAEKAAAEERQAALERERLAVLEVQKRLEEEKEAERANRQIEFDKAQGERAKAECKEEIQEPQPIAIEDF